MTSGEAKRLLMELYMEYDHIPNPKRRHINAEACEEMLGRLQTLKSELSEDRLYQMLLGALSQILAKQRRLTLTRPGESEWMNASERGINKAIAPLVRKPGKSIECPFDSEDPVTGNVCSVSNGHWEARNYMVMDVLSYVYLLKEGGDQVPEKASAIFPDLESVVKGEREFSRTTSKPADVGNPAAGLTAIDVIKKTENWVSFNDSDFRRLTSSSMSSSDILRLLLETSRVEFRLVYPVRLLDGTNRPRECPYRMNVFSRLFEFGYIDEDVRGEGETVRMRRYYVTFNTLMGNLFAHNLKAKNYDWIGRELYALPPSAQVLFRRCLVNNDKPVLAFNLKTIAQRVNLTDKHRANLKRTIIQNILEPLKGVGMIASYKLKEGLSGPKFVVYRKFPGKPVKGKPKVRRKGSAGGGKQSGGSQEQSGGGGEQRGGGQEQKIAEKP